MTVEFLTTFFSWLAVINIAYLALGAVAVKVTIRNAGNTPMLPEFLTKSYPIKKSDLRPLIPPTTPGNAMTQKRFVAPTL